MFRRIVEIVNSQNKWRREECLNMIASENVMSPLAEKLFLSDFEGRYNEHTFDGEEFITYYQGVKFAVEIEKICNKIFKQRFGTRFVDTRPIAGGIANLCVYRAFLKHGDIFFSPGLTAGGHVSSTRYGLAGVMGLKDIPMPFDANRMQCDVSSTISLIKKHNPKLIMTGRSVVLFPEPLKELRENTDSIIVYDAAHVFGLIYGRKFQQPLKEGADIITASTHKTFPGPQGGIIIAKSELKEEMWKKIEKAVFPGTISNHHIHRLPALAITALEMNEFGEEYARQTIKNAKAFAQALHEVGFKVLCEEEGFTQSHQVLVDVKEFGGGKVVAQKLESVNIIVNKIGLPWDADKDVVENPSGIRIGLQELTRWGMKEKDVRNIAHFYKSILIDGKEVEKVKAEVILFKRDFNKICYCF